MKVAVLIPCYNEAPTIAKVVSDFRQALPEADVFKSMKELMLNVAMGAKDENTLTSLANRVIRLNSQMTPKERTEFTSAVGTSAAAKSPPMKFRLFVFMSMLLSQ